MITYVLAILSIILVITSGLNSDWADGASVGGVELV